MSRQSRHGHWPASDDDITHRLDLRDGAKTAIGTSGRRQSNFLKESERAGSQPTREVSWHKGLSNDTNSLVGSPSASLPSCIIHAKMWEERAIEVEREKGDKKWLNMKDLWGRLWRNWNTIPLSSRSMRKSSPRWWCFAEITPFSITFDVIKRFPFSNGTILVTWLISRT